MKKLWKSIRELLKLTIFIILLFVSAYGLILTTSWMLDVSTQSVKSKFAEAAIARQLQKYDAAYKLDWTKKEGKAKVESEEFRIELLKAEETKEKSLHNGLEEAINLRDSEKKLSPEIIALYKDFNNLRYEKIKYFLGQDKNQNFLDLFFRGLMINLLSLIALIFVLGKKSELADFDFFDKDAEDLDKETNLIIFLPVLIFFVCQIVVIGLLGFSSQMTALSVVFTLVAAIFFLLARFEVTLALASTFYKLINQLLSFLNQIIGVLACKYIKKNVRVDIFGYDILNGLEQKNDFFLVASDGVKRVRVKKNDKGLLPVFSKTESRSISLDRFYYFLTQGSKAEAFSNLHKQLINKISGYFKIKGEEAAVSYMEQVVDSIKKDVSTKLVKQKLIGSGIHDSATESIMVNLLNQSLKSFRKELLALTKTELESAFVELKQTLLREISSRERSNGSSVGLYASTKLPTNTKFFLQEAKSTVFVIEQLPQLRTIDYKGTKFHLAFPYVIFVPFFTNGEFSRMLFFYSKQALKTLDDRVYRPSLNNVFDDCSICMGSTSEDMIDNFSGSLGEKADVAVSCFWQSNFNNDASDNHDKYADKFKEFKNYRTWEEFSAQNSKFPLNLDYFEAGRLSELIAKQINDDNADDNSLTELTDQVNSWFKDNDSTIREKVIKNWSEIKLRPFSQTVVRNLRTKESSEAENTFKQIKLLCLDGISKPKIKKGFVNTVNKAFAKAVKEDFANLELTVPLKRKIAFPELIKSDL